MRGWAPGLCGLVLLSACTDATTIPPHNPAEQNLVVFTSVPPMAWLAEAVGGAGVSVHALVSGGQDPHHFEASPRQVAALARASLYFAVGLPFERGRLARMEEALTGMEIVTLVEPDEARAHEDPHIWTSPLGAAKLAAGMAGAYCRVDRAHCRNYRRNYRDLERRLAALHEQLNRKLAPLRGAEFFVMHAAWSHFADAYGLTQIALEREGRLPGARHLAGVIEQARTAQARAIFIQPQFSSRRARVVANAVSAEMVPLDPMAYELPRNLRRVARRLARYVSPR